MSSSNCWFLTCIWISQEAGQVVWYSDIFQNYPQFLVIHTVKGFGMVNKAEIDVFLELSCFFNPADVGNLISGSSAFSKTSLNIWKFAVHVLLKPGLENFEHYFASVWNECNCVVVCTLFDIAIIGCIIGYTPIQIKRLKKKAVCRTFIHTFAEPGRFLWTIVWEDPPSRQYEVSGPKPPSLTLRVFSQLVRSHFAILIF